VFIFDRIFWEGIVRLETCGSSSNSLRRCSESGSDTAIVGPGIVLDEERSRVRSIAEGVCRELLVVAYHPWPISGRYCLPPEGYAQSARPLFYYQRR